MFGYYCLFSVSLAFIQLFLSMMMDVATVRTLLYDVCSTNKQYDEPVDINKKQTYNN